MKSQVVFTVIGISNLPSCAAWLAACVNMRAAMYYILEWMLASLIPHVDGAGIMYMAAIFRYCLQCLVYIYVCKIIAF